MENEFQLQPSWVFGRLIASTVECLQWEVLVKGAEWPLLVESCTATTFIHVLWYTHIQSYLSVLSRAILTNYFVIDE